MPSFDFDPQSYAELPAERQLSASVALLPVLATVVFLGVGSAWLKLPPHVPLFWSVAFTGLVGYYVVGLSWDDLYDGIANGLLMGLQALLILFTIYALIATWVSAGTIPGLMYYGLELLSPTVFLPVTAVLSAAVAFAIGSSWTTVGTLGVAFVGIGAGLGIPEPMAAGAILSGAYAGDKQSPFSDTTNLAAAVTNTDLYDHIHGMRLGTALAFGVAVAGYVLLGLRAAGTIPTGQIAELQTALTGTYTLSLVVFVPLVVTFGLAIAGYPALPALAAGVFAAVGTTALVQGASFTVAWEIFMNGTAPETGSKLVDGLLATDGLTGSAWTITVVVAALALGGLLERIGVLAALAHHLARGFRSAGLLVAGTGVSAIAVNALTAQQYMSIVLPGMTLRNLYEEHGLQNRDLSRAIESAGTPTGALIPWHAGGIYMASALNVPTLEYFPFYFFGFLSPLVLMFIAATGWQLDVESSAGQSAATAD
ncbi:Na+/H+ antiporter NhaC [halophilic archaeon]|nr:Na+/H+ antiporter NhaC [halophilic archaeon]